MHLPTEKLHDCVSDAAAVSVLLRPPPPSSETRDPPPTERHQGHGGDTSPLFSKLGSGEHCGKQTAGEESEPAPAPEVPDSSQHSPHGTGWSDVIHVLRPKAICFQPHFTEQMIL